jgi:hypothetical protein
VRRRALAGLPSDFTVYEGLRQWVALSRMAGEITPISAAARTAAVDEAERAKAEPPDVRLWAPGQLHGPGPLVHGPGP